MTNDDINKMTIQELRVALKLALKTIDVQDQVIERLRGRLEEPEAAVSANPCPVEA